MLSVESGVFMCVYNFVSTVMFDSACLCFRAEYSPSVICGISIDRFDPYH